MTNEELLSFLAYKGACYGAIEWLGSRDLLTAWAECLRGDWMLWLAARAAEPDAVRLRLAACDCAELSRHLYEDRYPGDARPREAIETARRFARGDATEQELSVAESAAWSARSAAAARSAEAVRIASLHKCAEIARTYWPTPPDLGGVR